MGLRLYLDEDVDVLLAELLRRDGHDVLSTRDVRRASRHLDDDSQLAFATSEERAILTHNVADFWSLSQRWMSAGKVHDGIILTVHRDPFILRERFRDFASRYPTGLANITDFL